MTLALARRNIGSTERGLIAKAWNNKCAYCKTTEGPFDVDHIVPHSAFGTCDVDNLCWACSKCNAQKKATRLPIFHEGLLLGIALRRAGAIRAKLKAVKRTLYYNSKVRPKCAARAVFGKSYVEKYCESRVKGNTHYVTQQHINDYLNIVTATALQRTAR